MASSIFGGDLQNHQEVLMSLQQLHTVVSGIKDQLKQSGDAYKVALARIKNVDSNVGEKYSSEFFSQDMHLLNMLLDHIENYDLKYIDEQMKNSSGYIKNI